MAPLLHTHQIHPRTTLNRLHFLLYSLSLLLLLHHHTTTTSSFLLLLADVFLAFMWLLSQGFRWRPVRRWEFPELLLKVTARKDFPALDVFICTADPYKEPPVGVASTALSALAFDYPSDRLSVYVSDDGGSDLTLFAFFEAAKFARCWLPFCRENGVMERSPEAYFQSSGCDVEAEKMKVMFERLKERVDIAMEKGYVDLNLVSSPEEKEIFKTWKNFTRKDHPSVIQVLLESKKDKDITGYPLPNLVYISREKHLASPHNFKAGALNTLLRVSETMTNAPLILTLDCDMCSNDPTSPQRALCYFLDKDFSPNLSFIQFPQRFTGLNKNDIYGGEFRRLFTLGEQGLDGLQGPNYVGTGCFFSRRSLYSSPSVAMPSSDEFKVQSCLLSSELVLLKAHEAASSEYEHGRKEWGSQIGFRYGSLVEDYYTGYMLHCQGWRSVFCNPDRPAFLGEAPNSLLEAVSQSKRWFVGLYQVCFSRYCPLFYGSRKISLMAGFCYMYYALWGCWCIPLTIYGLLPQLALFYGKSLFPKASDPWFFLYAYLFLSTYVQDLIEFMEVGGLIQRWWSEQRMWLIKGITSSTFGTLDFILSEIGSSATGFNLTSKVKLEEENKLYENDKFSFSTASPFFVSMGTIAIVNVISFIFGFIKAMIRVGGLNEMLIQIFLSGFIATNSWPIYVAMFTRKDGGKMPERVTKASILLSSILLFLGNFYFT
ncbi:cellulose synthase-like protein G3 [Dendrobium catenatum]|uniref:Cellulose synthase-like protein G3 n=1 Tax=Dendrobium catenatum TaxID=906689 RepID=A0A2I0WEN4_9ASPA|nr:cellulose synthase-like protein G3 [Dendrobium catenatum]PKU74131.1 Cellulose synthase-like protein G3 [Dendrobium catenatum]